MSSPRLRGAMPGVLKRGEASVTVCPPPGRPGFEERTFPFMPAAVRDEPGEPSGDALPGVRAETRWSQLSR